MTLGQRLEGRREQSRRYSVLWAEAMACPGAGKAVHGAEEQEALRRGGMNGKAADSCSL